MVIPTTHNPPFDSVYGERSRTTQGKQPIIIPTHIAIIMDGNRRWARERNLPQVAGHEKVANEILEPLIEHAAAKSIRYLTLWAWSTENWQRSKLEVNAIMQIFRHIVKKRWQRLHEKGVKIKVIGDISKFPQDIQKSLTDVVEQTKNNKLITAIFALNYGGRDELLRSFKKLAKEISNFKFQISNLNDQSIARCLDTSDIPNPDIIVRPGGEKRLSGFLPWQSVYSELFFYDWYMPEFSPEKMDEILDEYTKRHRRFGR